MYLIAGLGNPGDKYAGTRHNIGFDVVDKIAEKHNIRLNKLKFNAIYGDGNILGERVLLAKPTTYMNNSGIAINEIASYYKIPSENIIVIVDDIDIPFSSLRIKRDGSAGSHNGLKSIVKVLGTKDFPRIRIGVGKKHPKQDLADFVLGRFSKDERVYMDETVEMTVDALEEFLVKGIGSSMNKFNNKMTKAQE